MYVENKIVWLFYEDLFRVYDKFAGKGHLAGRICVIASTRLQDIPSSIERLSGRCCDDQLSHMTSTAEVTPLVLALRARHQSGHSHRPPAGDMIHHPYCSVSSDRYEI